ncbi:hypothetical protein TIFTF001_016699 [Ficus carica]|uniref:Transcriptional factor DELLA N-terminal domain-containing protein n=1 Tax=Ficus carica TaxID=3494 RepID=A0AA88A992_FICCA|nr:hypothetical protein TIFTF001_016699 [Ficus carica]
MEKASKLWVEDDGGMDELQVVLGYKVKSLDMEEVAQQLDHATAFSAFVTVGRRFVHGSGKILHHADRPDVAAPSNPAQNLITINAAAQLPLKLTSLNYFSQAEATRKFTIYFRHHHRRDPPRPRVRPSLWKTRLDGNLSSFRNPIGIEDDEFAEVWKGA